LAAFFFPVLLDPTTEEKIRRWPKDNLISKNINFHAIGPKDDEYPYRGSATSANCPADQRFFLGDKLVVLLHSYFARQAQTAKVIQAGRKNFTRLENCV